MRYTLKEMVDVILSAMDSDEVNSISDTVESNQVALLLKSVYYDIASQLKLPEHDTLFELESTTTSTPTVLTLPINCVRLDSIKYDYAVTGDTYKDYQPIYFVSFDEFLMRQQSLRERVSGVGSQTITLDGDTFDFLFYTDRQPSYYTVISDKYIVCDAYDNTEDTILQSEKTMCRGWMYPTFSLTDAFAPNLDPTQFSYYLNKAKVRAFAELKQVENAEAGREARQQHIQVQRNERRTPDVQEVFKHKARFGRK